MAKIDKEGIKALLQLIATILTAVATSLGMQSCMTPA